uniref:Uncharacterized protein n=1 Tax=Arundo donax TaxID=35708 RepID=A0A0A8Z7M2_ARUDO
MHGNSVYRILTSLWMIKSKNGQKNHGTLILQGLN